MSPAEVDQGRAVVPKAIVAGAGPVGLATAMLLANDGYDVTVLDSDTEPPPDDAGGAWGTWQRKGVAQFRQPHLMLPRLRHLLDTELPEVRDRIAELGGRRLNLTGLLPPPLRAHQQGDERFETITARRPVVDLAFAQAAQRTARLEIQRGVGAEGPVSGRSVLPGVPHVAGVRTSAGGELFGDVIVDATGRRSKFPAWVQALGGRPPAEEVSDAGFAYYTRHFKSRNGSVPELRGPLGVDLATVRVLTLPGDNGTWQVAVIPMAGDAPFKALRHKDVWTRVVGAFPHAAHWLDGEAVSEVLAMAGVLDRHRRNVVDGAPVVTGLVPVGDAWACTNPTAGRGISLGVAHAVALRDALRQSEDPAQFILSFDQVTEATLTPWYRDQVLRDRRRAADTQALVEGQPLPPPDAERAAQSAFFAAAAADAAVARASLDVLGCLALPEAGMRRPEIADRVKAFAGRTPPEFPGPTRADLLAVLS